MDVGSRINDPSPSEKSKFDVRSRLQRKACGTPCKCLISICKAHLYCLWLLNRTFAWCASVRVAISRDAGLQGCWIQNQWPEPVRKVKIRCQIPPAAKSLRHTMQMSDFNLPGHLYCLWLLNRTFAWCASVKTGAPEKHDLTLLDSQNILLNLESTDKACGTPSKCLI